MEDPKMYWTPANSVFCFYNYKGTFSVVLLALVDADFWWNQFLAVDMGGFNSNSDGGIFANPSPGQALQAGTLNVPAPCPLLSAPELGSVPLVIVVDEALSDEDLSLLSLSWETPV